MRKTKKELSPWEMLSKVDQIKELKRIRSTYKESSNEYEKITVQIKKKKGKL